MLFVNAVAVVVAVVFFPVSRRGIPIVIGTVPQTEDFRKLFENFLTGLAMQSVVFGVGFQFVSQFAFIRIFTGLVARSASVGQCDVPQFLMLTTRAGLTQQPLASGCGTVSVSLLVPQSDGAYPRPEGRGIAPALGIILSPQTDLQQYQSVID